MANVITKIITALSGEVVGQDAFGNIYYHQKKVPQTGRRRRWVIYAPTPKGLLVDDASRVPAEFHAWLHYTVDSFPEVSDNAFVEPQFNKTGTTEAYRPQGHALETGKRPAATGDYQAWSPEG
jgi:NADH:ubiquinone oxidoreductase subunit